MVESFDALTTSADSNESRNMILGFYKIFLQMVAFNLEDYARHRSLVIQNLVGSFPATFAAPSRNKG